jgi:acetylornithine/succinyldiaminopimelate/putrescine aminotransferase
MTQRELFLKHVGQTSTSPLAFEVSKAEGCYLYDAHGKKHIDLIGGISVCNLGHGNERIKTAVKKQVDDYMHVMVYGESVLSPQVNYAKEISDVLPENLNSVYFTNSGSEATEGAMKLAKRYTGRSKILSFKNSYHGSTQGALSVMGSEYWQQAYRPLLPNVYQFDYGSQAAVDAIDEQTACIILEPMQSEAGIHEAPISWFKALRKKCHETNCLLIFDEIQTGFGRCGSLFAMNKIGVTPDIVLLGKALGGGMPIGAFVSDKKIMDAFSTNPVLGHITTFGGHPVCCAAGRESLAIIQDLFEEEPDFVHKKSKLFKKHLKHDAIKKVSTYGLLIAVHFEDYDTNKKIIDQCIVNGAFTDWFLFADNALRIAPPLIISEEEILEACKIVIQSINEILHAGG